MQDNFEFRFYRLPKLLFENETYTALSLEAKVLFALILDRMCLSQINGERFTHDGEPYVIYTREETMKLLNIGKDKAAAVIKELEKSGLIKVKRKKMTDPYMIFVTDYFFEVGKTDIMRSEKPSSRGRQNRCHEDRKSAPNDTDKSDTDFSDTLPSQEWVTAEQVKEQIEYDCVFCKEGRELIDEIVLIMCDVMNTTQNYLYIGKDKLPSKAVIERFRMLNCEHIGYVVNELNATKSRVKNIKKYVTALLYNAPATMNCSVSAEFSYNTFNRN